MTAISSETNPNQVGLCCTCTCTRAEHTLEWLKTATRSYMCSVT